MIEHKSIQTIKVDLNDMTADRRVRLSPRSIGRLPGGVIRAGDVVELVDDEDGDCLLVALATVEKDDWGHWVARPLEWPPREEPVERQCKSCDEPDPFPLQPDMVNHPPHYALLQPEPIDVIEAWQLGFHEGNALKYLARAGRKDPTKTIEDLEKAVWYLNRAIKQRKENA